MESCRTHKLILWIFAALIGLSEAKVTFEKMTNMDYTGTTYYSVRNLSLYECQGWCKDEADCVAAVFSFVVNPLTPVQETTCLLQNETQARKPSATPQKAVNMFFLTKIHLRTEQMCDRLWSFERVPNHIIRGMDNAIVFTSNKEACLTACLNEVRFTCRSVEFNYVTLQCHLCEYDRRSPSVHVKLVEAQGVDYFENTCLSPDQLCPEGETKSYAPINIGIPQQAVAHFVDLYYYPDKAFLVSSKQECLRQCSLENQFVCRSILYRPEPSPAKSRCELYHLDHMGYPDGSETFGTPSPIPLLDSGETRGLYLESVCGNGTTASKTPSYAPRPPALPVVHKEEPLRDPQTTQPSLVTQPKDPSCDDYGVCYDVSIQCTDSKILVYVRTNRPFHGRIYALGRSETCNSNVRNSQQFRLDMSLSGQDCNTQSLQSGVYSNTIVLQHHNVVLTKADKVYNVKCTYETTSKNVSFGMMPVRYYDDDWPDGELASRDPDLLQITASPEAPLPKIVILSTDGREASTVRIGDKLTFRIEIPSQTPYGIFARSCVAMAKDARSTFEIIDERGCPVDANLFPHFNQINSGLESNYDAFRFTESYGVIFQCNVKYCVGKCEPVTCGTSLERSWGRKKRSSSQSTKEDDEMTLSREILVLDFGDEISRATKETLPSANATFTVRETLTIDNQCASRSSIMALSVTSAVLLVVYICTVAYFVAQRRAIKGLH